MDEFIQGFWNFAQHYWWLIFPIMEWPAVSRRAGNAAPSADTSAVWRLSA